jgi:FAD:protein FMN transferase
MNRRVFRSMGCEVVVAGPGRPPFEEVVRLFEQRDATFSRFRPESELVRVNAAASPVVRVSSAFAAAVAASLGAARATGGLIDPTLGAAIVAAGYDADFATLTPDPRPVDPVRPADWRQLRIADGLFIRPPGITLDLNGVVKAMTVDEAAALLGEPGFVSAGGDIATREMPIVVALPEGGAVTLETGGIATSGSATRRWLRGGVLQHHLLDPRTGRPSTSPWTYVTAVGRDCLSADIAAKAGFLLGDDGPGWLEDRGVAARFVADGAIVENRCWAAGLEPEPDPEGRGSTEPVTEGWAGSARPSWTPAGEGRAWA